MPKNFGKRKNNVAAKAIGNMACLGAQNGFIIRKGSLTAK